MGKANQVWTANMVRLSDHAEIRRLKRKHPKHYEACVFVLWPSIALLMAEEDDAVSIDDICRETDLSRIVVQRRVDRLVDVKALRRIVGADECLYASSIVDRLRETFRKKNRKIFEKSIIEKTAQDEPMQAVLRENMPSKTAPYLDQQKNLSDLSGADAPTSAEPVGGEHVEWSEVSTEEIIAMDAEPKAENLVDSTMPAKHDPVRVKKMPLDWLNQHGRDIGVVFDAYAQNALAKNGIDADRFLYAINATRHKKHFRKGPGECFWGTAMKGPRVRLGDSQRRPRGVWIR